MQGDVPRLENMAAREVAIHISNHSMVKADRGVVIVGASVELGAVGNTADSGSTPGVDIGPLHWLVFSPSSIIVLMLLVIDAHSRFIAPVFSTLTHRIKRAFFPP